MPEERSPGILRKPRSKGLADEPTRLCVMPLAVLLPRMGALSNLGQYAADFNRRLAELHGERSSFSADEGGEATKRQSEELMLNQVLQWLSVGEENS